MSEESIHDIIREMMNCTAVKSKVPHSTVEDILNPPIIHFNLEQRTIVRDFAYRIAAAEERRKTTEPEKNSGNAAAMREALEKIRERCVIYNNDLAEEIDAICGNALAAPARNCDRYADATEMARAFLKDPYSTLGRDSLVEVSHRFAEWAFAPAEGGAE